MTASARHLRVLLVALGLVCGGLAMASPAQPVLAQGRVRISEDVVYSSPDGNPLLLDAFAPADPGLHPGLIAIHGGGWHTGDKREWDNNCRQLAMEGFACFSIDYRLAPADPYPAAVDDALAAVQWVRDHADEYGVDPGRLGAIGSSAGGHLAAMIAYMGQGSTDTGSRVRLAIVWSPVTDITTLIEGARNVNVSQSQVHDFLDCDLTKCAGRVREASPVTYVDPSDPPTFIANSTDEQIPLSQAKELASVLTDSDVPHELHVVVGTNHGARLKNQIPRDGGGTVWDQSIEFIRQWIDTPGGSPSPSPSPLPVPTGSAQAAPSSSGDGTLFLVVAAVGVAVVAGLIGLPLLRRRRLR